MTKILFTFLALSLLIIGGTFAGRSLATAPKLTQAVKWTMVQETKDNGGKLLGTQATVHDSGRHYWKYTKAETGESETWLLNQDGGFRDALDPKEPLKMFQIRGAGRLMVMPESLQSWAGFQNQPGFVRFDQYQGFTVAVIRDEEAENWIAPEFWPRPLKTVRVGATTETVQLTIGEADEKVFETPK